MAEVDDEEEVGLVPPALSGRPEPGRRPFALSGRIRRAEVGRLELPLTTADDDDKDEEEEEEDVSGTSCDMFDRVFSSAIIEVVGFIKFVEEAGSARDVDALCDAVEMDADEAFPNAELDDELFIKPPPDPL